MVAAEIDLLKRLQNWYHSQRDGEWEHQYGVSIGTLDNPGWSFKVDLADTGLIDRPFDERRVERSDEDWYVCRRTNVVFEGFCGPAGLGDVIAVFLNWAKS